MPQRVQLSVTYDGPLVIGSMHAQCAVERRCSRLRLAESHHKPMVRLFDGRQLIGKHDLVIRNHRDTVGDAFHPNLRRGRALDATLRQVARARARVSQ